MNYQDWHSVALELSSQGLSGRKIAKQIGKAKSSVNDVLKAHREGLLKLEKPKDKEIKILFWDLESSLMEGYFFRIWEENIPYHRITKHSQLLSNSWAFGDDEPSGVRVTPEQVKTGDDLHVVLDMIEQINKADLMVTFNGKKFDEKLLNTRALYWGLPPVSYPKHIDLMQDSKRRFKFPSNAMQNISMYLGLNGKIENSGNRLWERAAKWQDYETCEQALKDMLKYGLQDINATRDLYYRILGWSKTTPNIATITKQVQGKDLKEDTELLCTHCGSSDVSKIVIDGMVKQGYTSVSSFDLYRCGESSCRGVSRVNASGKALVNYI